MHIKYCQLAIKYGFKDWYYRDIAHCYKKIND